MPAGSITIKLTAADGDFQAGFARARKAIAEFDKFVDASGKEIARKFAPGPIRLFGSAFSAQVPAIRSVMGLLGQATKALGDHRRAAELAGAALGRSFAFGLSAVKNFATNAVSHLLSVKTLILAIVAGFGARAFVNSLLEANELLDGMSKKARVLGLSLPFFSGLAYSASLANQDVDVLTRTLSRAQRNLGEFARTGKGPAAEALATLRIRARDGLNELRPLEELLPEIAKALAEVGSAGNRIDLASKIFGREGGTEFLQLLDSTGNFFEILPQRLAEAKRLGVLFTPDQAKRANELSDALARIRQATFALKVAIVQEIAPAATAFLDAVAYKLGAIATAIPTVVRAIRGLAFGDADPIRQESLRKFLASTRSLLFTTAAELGSIIGRGLIEAIRIGFAILAPDLEDLARDTLGPILNQVLAQIPGASTIEPTTNERIRQLRASRDVVLNTDANRDIRRRATTLDWEMRNQNLSNEQFDKKAGDLKLLRERIVELEDFTARVDADIAKLEKVASERGAKVAAALAESVQKSGARMQKAIDEATTNVGKAGETFEASWLDLMTTFTDVAPEPAAAEHIRTFFDTIASLPAKAAASMRSGIITAKRLLPEISDTFRRFQQASLGLQGDLAESRGQDTEAARLRLRLKYIQDLQALQQSLGPAAGLLTPTLDEIYQRDLARIGVDESGDNMPLLKQLKNGWAAATTDMMEKSRRWADFTKDTLTGAVGEFSSSLADALSKGEVSFKNFGRAAISILGDVAQMATKAVLQFLLLGGISSVLGGFGGGGTTPGVTGADAGNLGALAANGLVLGGGHVVPFGSGGIATDGARAMPMSGGRWAVWGERGPEVGFSPLAKVNGMLGVRSLSSPINVQIVDNRRGGAPVQTSTSQGPDGATVLRVTINDEIESAINSGRMDRALRNNYGISRQGVRR